MADIIDGLYSWVSFLPRITKTNLVEIIIIAILLYELLVWIMNTRAWTLLKGILLILFFYVLTYIFRLDNIKWILNTIATPAVTMAIVIFQPELRKALEQLGSRNPLTGILTFDDGKDNSAFTDRTINELVKATFEMAKVKTGALMVIERGDSLKDLKQVLKILCIHATGRSIGYFSKYLYCNLIVSYGRKIAVSHTFTCPIHTFLSEDATF